MGVPSEVKPRRLYEDDRLPPGIEPSVAMVCATVREWIEPETVPAVMDGLEHEGIGVVEVTPVARTTEPESESEAEAEGPAPSGMERDAGVRPGQSDPESVALVRVVVRRESDAARNMFVDLRGSR